MHQEVMHHKMNNTDIAVDTADVIETPLCFESPIQFGQISEVRGGDFFWDIILAVIWDINFGFIWDITR